MLFQTNSKKQGDVGVGRALAYFSEQGYAISIPLTESQRYDLIVDDKVSLKRVEIKTTRHKSPYGRYLVNLSTKGGNRTGVCRNTKLSKYESDLVFIVTESDRWYLFPTELFHDKASLNLAPKWNSYIVRDPVKPVAI